MSTKEAISLCASPRTIPSCAFATPSSSSVDKELVELVREICNQVNLASIGLRAVYTFDEDHLHVNVHFFDNLYLEPSRAKGMLTQSMKEMFSWRDAFVRWMDTVKEKRKKYGANSPEEIEEQYKRLILIIREHELDKSEDTMSVRESAVHHITLSELVQDAVGIKSFVPSLLSVAGDGLSLVMDASQDAQLRSKMADYVLSDALVSDGQFARRCATLQLVFFQPEDPDERRYLTVSLVARETSPEALFFQTTVVLTPRLATLENPADCVNDHPTACSLLMAYDLKNEKQLRDEFQYMWTDAKDKLVHGQIGKMTEDRARRGPCDDPLAGRGALSRHAALPEQALLRGDAPTPQCLRPLERIRRSTLLQGAWPVL